METRNHKWARMLVASILLLILSCSQSRINHSNYDIKLYKSKAFTSYATTYIMCFEKDSTAHSRNQIPCGININGVIFVADSGRLEINLTAGNYDINAFFPGKKKAVLKDLHVSASDSIRLKIFLEDDNSPLE